MNKPIERQGAFAELISSPDKNIYEIPKGLDKNYSEQHILFAEYYLVKNEYSNCLKFYESSLKISLKSIYYLPMQNFANIVSSKLSVTSSPVSSSR